MQFEHNGKKLPPFVKEGKRSRLSLAHNSLLRIIEPVSNRKHKHINRIPFSNPDPPNKETSKVAKILQNKYPIKSTPSWVVFFFLAMMFLGPWFQKQALAVPLESLKTTLVQDGFHPDLIDAFYAEGFTPQYRTIATTFRIRESRLDYGQFLQPADLARARRFAEQYRTALREAETLHGADASVIVAILLVETRFGSYTGRTPTLDILSSFAVMNDPAQRDRIWHLLSPEDRARLGREAFDERLLRRSEWAYNELCALIRIWTEEGKDVRNLKGSIMGAVGWAQFLPSSYVNFGYDGDNDGRIDLFNPIDAIFSVANYLRAHGWNEAKTREEKEKVIHAYNKSQPYVNTILAIAERL